MCVDGLFYYTNKGESDTIHEVDISLNTINSISVKYNMFRRRLGHPEVSQTISKAHGGRNVQVVV